MQPIKEDEEQTDELRVLRPIKGIEVSKYQPIIRDIEGVKVNFDPIEQTSMKMFVRQMETDSMEEVLKTNADKIAAKFKNQRKAVVSVSEAEVQTLKELIEERGVNTSFRSEYEPKGALQMSPLKTATQKSRFDEKLAPSTT